jgi:hypothetical protein
MDVPRDGRRSFLMPAINFRTSAHLKIRMETTPFAKSYGAAREAVVDFYNRNTLKERSSRAASFDDSDDEFELVHPRSQPEDLEAKKGRLAMLRDDLLVCLFD